MTTPRTVLIAGAGIAGPVLAYWLHRSGFAVTVAERSGAPRDGGYPIDIRGTAIDVVRRMGILPRLRAAHVDMRRCTFLGPGGDVVAAVAPHAVAGSAEGHDLEVRRGDLTAHLYALVRDDVEVRFGTAVDALEESAAGVDVTFGDGQRRTYDLVVGADGMHSATRRSVFGPEAQFHRYLGYGFAIFTMPNTFGLARELLVWNTPGRAAALYAVDDGGDLHAFLTFHRPDPPARVGPDLVAEVFADAGWEVPGIVDAMHDAGDLFLDTAGQIRMPRWSSGRVALVGDAGYAPSFLTGQGTSLALVGAYMLAHALATHRDHSAAFAAYERGLRPFVAANQALVGNGSATLFPTTAEALAQRNARLRDLAVLPAATPRPAHSALVLPGLPPTGSGARARSGTR